MTRIWVRKKLPLIATTALCIVILTIYTTDTLVSSYYQHCDVHNVKLPNTSKSKNSNGLAHSRNRTSLYDSKLLKIQEKWFQKKVPDSPPNQVGVNSKQKAPIFPEEHSVIRTQTVSHSTASKIKDVLMNVSFADVMQVMDLRNLNDSIHLNEWEKAYMNNRLNYSFEGPSWVHKGKSVCEKDTEMVIIIPAVPSHVFDRQLIRQTWASSIYGMHFPQIRPNSLRTKLAFVFGTSRLSVAVKNALNEEASRYNDVVAADFVDSYGNLSLKMMVGLNWASTFCSGAKYVLKADLDTFVNIPLLSAFLLQVSENIPDYILGHKHVITKHPVSRKGRWKVARKDYPFESYPPYLLGHSYVITSKLVPMILSAGRRIPLIPVEDALVTGVLARAIQAPRLHHEGFATVSRKVFPCRIVYNHEMTVTRMTASRYILLWRDVLTNACKNDELPASLDDLLTPGANTSLSASVSRP